MAHQGEMPKSATIDRSDRHGHIGLVLLLAAVLVGVLFLALLTETFGWVFVGLVVPGTWRRSS